MKKLKFHWPDRLCLPRKWKIARNLFVAVCLVTVALIAMDWPAMTMGGAYRQQEGKMMLFPSEIVYSHKTKREAVFITQGDGWITAGVVDKMSFSNHWFPEHWAVIQHIVSDEELAVLPMSVQTEDSELVIAVHGFPEGTASAKMELDLSGIEGVWYDDRIALADETVTALVDTVKEDWMFFTFVPHDHSPNMCAITAMWANQVFPWLGFDEYAYRLEFYDEQGDLLESVSANLPECSHVML